MPNIQYNIESKEKIGTVKITEEFTLVSLTCQEIVTDPQIERFHESVLPLVENKSGMHLILDFSTVQYISSSALGCLINLLSRIDQQQGRLILCGIAQKLKNSSNDKYMFEIFKIVKLDKFFTLCSDLASARRLLQEGGG